jgi:hypothetical protein
MSGTTATSPGPRGSVPTRPRRKTTARSYCLRMEIDAVRPSTTTSASTARTIKMVVMG